LSGLYTKDPADLSFFFVAYFIRVNLQGESLGDKTERGMTWTDHSSGKGMGQAKRRILFDKFSDQLPTSPNAAKRVPLLDI
jgi:hypothetical protein